MNTKNVTDRYKQIVLTSSLLDPYQRDAMLDGAEEYPEAYLEAMIQILVQFDERSRARDTAYKEKLMEAFDRYERTIGEITDLVPTKREKLLTQARTLKNVIIPSL
ncbi:hypothetical protein HY032_03385 [Candidatus Gottesmanbacteria bacterium]|nr:hypothetical protein [Candidatus Gottesmanbacteria bacterium]